MDSFGLGKSNESRVHQFTLPRGDIVISPHFSDASRDEADRFLLESLGNLNLPEKPEPKEKINTSDMKFYKSNSGKIIVVADIKNTERPSVFVSYDGGIQYRRMGVVGGLIGSANDYQMLLDNPSNGDKVSFSYGDAVITLGDSKLTSYKGPSHIEAIPFPDQCDPQYLLKLPSGEYLSVIVNSYTLDLKLYQGKPGSMKEINILHSSRLSDGGTILIQTKGGGLFIPSPFSKGTQDIQPMRNGIEVARVDQQIAVYNKKGSLLHIDSTKEDIIDFGKLRMERMSSEELLELLENTDDANLLQTGNGRLFNYIYNNWETVSQEVIKKFKSSLEYIYGDDTGYEGDNLKKVVDSDGNKAFSTTLPSGKQYLFRFGPANWWH